MLKYGKRPARSDARDALYATFRAKLAAAGKLPATPPPPWGHGNDFEGEAWLMLGNGPDETIPPEWTAAREGCSDCAWACPAHIIMELASNTGRPVPPFNGKVVVEQYAEYSGYDPTTGANDNGSDLREVLKWWQTKGIRDADGTIHKIGPFVALEPKNLEHLLECAHLFEFVMTGVEVPASAQHEFNEGKPWSVVPEAKIEGGHCVPFMGEPSASELAFVTWARRTLATNDFYTTYNDEAYAVITAEQFKAVTGKDYEGYDEAQLEEYLGLVGTGS
jgi:hypothetical protein